MNNVILYSFNNLIQIVSTEFKTSNTAYNIIVGIIYYIVENMIFLQLGYLMAKKSHPYFISVN